MGGDTRTLQVSFGGGIISPELHGRIDDPKYASGLAECTNWIVRPQGSIENRPGFAFVRATKYSGQSKARLIPFVFSSDQTMVLEFGNGYIRFHTMGQTVVSGSQPYEVATPYSASDLPGLHYVQSNDVMTIVHPNHAPRELRRYGATNWVLSVIDFGAAASAPTGLSVHANFGNYEFLIYRATIIDTNSVFPLPAQITTESSHFIVSTGVFVPQGGNFKVRLNVVVPPAAANNQDNSSDGKRFKLCIYRQDPGQSSYRLIFEDFTIQYDVLGREIIDSNIPGGVQTYPQYPSVSSGFGPPPYPVNFTAEHIGSNTDEEHAYVVTAIAANGISESVASAVATVKNDLLNPGAYNRVSWNAVDGATGYNVYKRLAGVFGFIGTVSAPTVEFTDNNITPDLSKTPPLYDNVFDSPGNYPSAVTYYEQRRVFAGTYNMPQHVWMTRSGTESDMSYSIPSKDDDRVLFRVVALQASRIQHMFPLADLVLLTDSTEFRVRATNKDAITPTSIDVKPQTHIGVNEVQPNVVNNVLLYCAKDGGWVYELAYGAQYDRLSAGNTSIRATHLFDDNTLVDMAYSKAPIPIAWFVSSNGKLLGFTYMPEQQVGAWHSHETVNGAFESCCSISENGEDRLYVIVRRVIDGRIVRYIERMAPRFRRNDSVRKAFFIDSGASFSKANGDIQYGNAIHHSGINHLVGQKVVLLIDGCEQPESEVLLVDGKGYVSFGVENDLAELIHVGLPITATVKTLPAVIQTNSGPVSSGRTKNIGKVFLRVHQTAGLNVTVDADGRYFKERTDEPFGQPPRLRDGEIEVLSSARWGTSGQFSIVQTKPLPATVLSLSAEVSIGG
jgi:hypothetical protein